MEAKATGRFIRVSPRKARLVIDLIRGKKVEEARTNLALCRKRAALPVKKVLDSALANATQKEGVDVDTLKVKEAYVDVGPSLKRFRARAMGRAARVMKRTSHITVVLEET